MGQATKKIDKLWMRYNEELLGKLVDTKISENMTVLQEKLQNAYENFKRDVDALSEKYKWIEISNKHVLAVEYKDDYVLFVNPIHFDGLRVTDKISGEWYQDFELPDVEMVKELMVTGKKDCPLFCPCNGIHRLSTPDEEKRYDLVQSDEDEKTYGSTQYIACKSRNELECTMVSTQTGTTIGNYLISDKDILKIPVKKFSKCHHPTYDSFRDMSWPIFLLEYNLIPEKLKEKEYISLLFQGCEKLDTSTEEIEMKAAWKQEIQEGRYPEIGGIFFDRKKLEQKVLSDDQPKILDGDLFEFVKKQLAECDKRRINRTPYSLERLQDPNQGHWELWPDPSSKNLRNQGKNPKKQKNSGYIQFNCPQGMFARNPVEDIVEDGVVGIDFGTKSTIVVRLDEHSQIRQMRVGRGDLSKGIRQGDFENPTIMEFTDIPSFLKRYREKEGRPDTRWNDVAISHEAKNDFFADTDSDNYYAFFSDLKQWCADDTRQIMLRDKCGNERILPDFLEINDTMFNPIELYAYYLGLFINNMDNKIYMRYILSYPVNYSVEIRKKILKCFEAGIRKSMPQQVLADEEVMKLFDVSMGASEPAAYAICALREFGFEPESDKPVFYGIYDFGGGTTDFDYGLWKKVDNSRRYTREINHFGAGGVKYLGGENLLEKMAYEILKMNRNELRAKKIKFARPVLGKDFDESSALVGDSQYARRNINNVAEKLRAYWEDPEILKNHAESVNKPKDHVENVTGSVKQENAAIGGSVADSVEKTQAIERLTVILEAEAEQKNSQGQESGTISNETGDSVKAVYSGKISVNLFDETGNMQAGVSLDVSEQKLFELLQQRIENGVDNFFQGLKNCSENPELDGMDNMKILLAGNSCKSPLVSKIFEEKIKKLADEMGREYTKNIEIIPPLGSKEAEEIQRENGIDLQRECYERPTGKTGVAYGLVLGRKGSEIKVVSEIKAQDQAKFNYYLGYAQNGKFQLFMDRNEIQTGTWYQWDSADTDQYELLYTSLPEATTNSMPKEKAKRKILKLEKEHLESESVYIRVVSPNEIEYAVASDEEAVSQGDYIEDPVKRMLSE